jgi:hypothetical protein
MLPVWGYIGIVAAGHRPDGLVPGLLAAGHEYLPDQEVVLHGPEKPATAGFFTSA